MHRHHSIVHAFFFSAVAVGSLAACGEEATVPDAQGSSIPPSMLPTDPGVLGDGGVLPAIEKALREAGVPDAGASGFDATNAPKPPPGLVLGCAMATEVEPNDDTPNPIGAVVCGELATPEDVDTFTANSSSKVQHVSVVATGDARFVIRGFGAEAVIDPATGIDIPAFGSFVRYDVRVSSPSSATLAYRIDVTSQ